MQQQNTAKSINYVALKDGTYQGSWFQANVFIENHQMTIPVNGSRSERTAVQLHVVNGKAVVEVK